MQKKTMKKWAAILWAACFCCACVIWDGSRLPFCRACQNFISQVPSSLRWPYLQQFHPARLHCFKPSQGWVTIQSECTWEQDVQTNVQLLLKHSAAHICFSFIYFPLSSYQWLVDGVCYIKRAKLSVKTTAGRKAKRRRRKSKVNMAASKQLECGKRRTV